MKKKTIVVTYGSGGHQEQIRRLMNLVNESVKEEVQFVAITDSKAPIKDVKNIVEYISFEEVRDKHSLSKTMLKILPTLLKQVCFTLKIKVKYQPVGVISTGPGVSILPTLLLKLFGVKTVAFESWSRFTEPSISGKVLNRLVSRFYVQNESIKSAYKSAIYKGRL